MPHQQQMPQYNPNMQQQMPQQQQMTQQTQQMSQQQIPQQQQQIPHNNKYHNNNKILKILHISFIVNHFEHLPDVLKELCGIINNITLCDIDNQNLNIPSFVTSVPTIYLSNERILTNKDLFEWIESNGQNKKSSIKYE